MTIGVLPVGNADPTILSRLKDGLAKVFPETKTVIVNEQLPLPGPAFDKKRAIPLKPNTRHNSKQYL
jgi:hypothetical protein